MGVLEDSLITLENGNNKKVNDLQQRELVLSCEIEGLFSRASNSTTLTWSKENPIITKKLTVVTHKWRESVSNFRLINNKLKISQDGLVLFKNDENITSWGYSKSLRKGYFLFNDKYEFEQINSIKRIREDSEMVCLSVSPNQYYFVNGYLIHNTYLCDACDTCKILPTLWHWYGPHTHDSTDPPISTTYGHNNTQAQLYSIGVDLYAKKIASSSDHTWSYVSSSYQTTPWNYFPRMLRLKYGSSTAVAGNNYAYYVMKYWDSNLPVPTTSNNGGGTPFNRGPGWVSWLGARYTNNVATYGDAFGEAKQLITDGYAVPLDPWYHAGYAGQGNLDLSARLLYTGTSGAAAWYTSDEGTTWTLITANTSVSAQSGGAGGYITINESTMGGQGNSKIYIIYLLPLPSLSGNLTYNFRWDLEKAPLYSFTSHTFTNCGISGRSGPTTGQCTNFYGASGNWWNNTSFFDVAGAPGVLGIQCWKCPLTGLYKVTARGAAGGDFYHNSTYKAMGGHGALVSHTFKLEGGHWYWILPGQMGTHAMASTGYAGAGGGGGTFFAKVPRNSTGVMNAYGVVQANGGGQIPNNSISSSDILLIAGGGGGASGHTNTTHGRGGWWNRNSPPSWWHPSGPSTITGGTGGSGGSNNGYYAGGGGSYTNDGGHYNNSYNTGGASFMNGGQGGSGHTGAGASYSPYCHGGFGGGGGGSYHAGGGGGGVYGGDAAIPYTASGEGGGSIVVPNYDVGNSGASSATKGADGPPYKSSANGFGFVKIEYLGIFNDLYPFTSHMFTNCGKTGRNGPTLSECKSSYGGTGWWNDTDHFNVTGATGVNGIQVWTVPATKNYTITAKGAREGWSTTSNGGGEGAIVESTFTLTKGDKYMILVGQMGSIGNGNGNWWASGGGGGTFMVKGDDYTNITLSDALIVAGGAGGTAASSSSGSGPAIGGDGENSSSNNTHGGDWGTNGSSNGCGGGGGLISNGVRVGAYAGLSFKNGGQGGNTNKASVGGFGGGGAGGGNPGGGGGGIFGGDFATAGTPGGAGYNWGGKGGGSHVNSSGTNTTFSTSNWSSHGQLFIVADASTSVLYSFTSHTFTNCGSTGTHGPTLSECTSSYGGSNNWWNNTDYFNVTGASGVAGIQVWTVPATKNYTITAKGAREGYSAAVGGSSGAIVEATFSLTKGDKYMILVGQMGSAGTWSGGGWYASGGGGGTFMVKGGEGSLDYQNITLSDALIVAGGGGGSSAGSSGPTSGNTGEDGINSSSNTTSGGQNSNISSTNGGGGGGGLIGDGAHSGRGRSFTNGGQGGTSAHTDPSGRGGFGGGAGAGGNPGGGGGGIFGGDWGYSGVGTHSTYNKGGRGGGSHVNSSGSSITFSASTNDTHGSLEIVSATPSSVPSVTALSDSGLYSFSSHTFTNCSSTGYRGPTLANCQGSVSAGGYGTSGFWHETDGSGNQLYFGVTGQSGVNHGIQWWKVPATGEYDVDVYGASGGSGTASATEGGQGARIKGRFTFTQGDYYWIIVGQRGEDAVNAQSGGGGGGGSFLVKTPLANEVDFNSSKSYIQMASLKIAAGGGGGSSRSSTGAPGQDASGTPVSSSGAGGAASASYNSGGGGGFISNGSGTGMNNAVTTGGYGFKTSALQGGAGDPGHYAPGIDGGFGGGGGSSAHAGGGGGGATGGNGPSPWQSNPNGKAGTSYISGATASVTGVSTLTHPAHGQIIITAVGGAGGVANPGGNLGDLSIDPNGWATGQTYNGS